MKRDPARAGDPGQRVIRALVNLGPEADAGLVFPRAKRMHENQEAFTMGPKSKCSGPVGAKLQPTQTLLFHTMDTKGDVER